MSKRFIPLKFIISISFISLVFWPFTLYSGLSLATIVFTGMACPIFILILALVLGAVYEIFSLTKIAPYVICIKNGELTYTSINDKECFDTPWTILISDIKYIKFKNKGEEISSRKGDTDKKLIVLQIDMYTQKIMDVTSYSNRQIKKIIKLLNEVIE